MPASVQQALIIRYADMVEHAFQQMTSHLRDKVMMMQGAGLMTAFNVMNPGDVQEITGQRDTRTVWQDIDQFNRWAPHRAFNRPVLLSRYDQLSAFTDLQRPYVENGVMANLRNIDTVLIEAATGPAVQGQTPGSAPASVFDTAAPNPDGTGGNLIPAGGDGMTSDKLRLAMGAFLTRNVGITPGIGQLRRGEFTAMMGGNQMRELLEITDVTSWDFIGNLGPDNAPLIEGFVARYAGFNIVISNLLQKPTATTRRCLVWHKRAMGLALWAGSMAAAQADGMDGGATTASFYITIDRLPDYNNAVGSQIMSNFGACRVQDAGVIAIDVVEA